MKPKKMSLKEIQGVLSRAEMKKIMAGSGDGCSNQKCFVDADCTGSCYTCVYKSGGGSSVCSSHL